MKDFRKKAQMYIDKFNQIHNNRYGYDINSITSSQSVIPIKCPDHGIYYKQIHKHLTSGCPKCKTQNDGYDDAIQKAIAKFGNKFLYHRSTFLSASEKMKITCPCHGDFYQSLVTHTRLTHGCPKCGFEATKAASSYTLEDFIAKARLVHGDKYDYSLVIYVNSTTPVKIRCKEHDYIFEQEPASHLRGRGCPLCGRSNTTEAMRMTHQEFLLKVKEVWGDTFDLSKVRYINSGTKVEVICRTHGSFMKDPSHLLSGSGCPMCCPKNTPYTTAEFIAKAKEIHGDTLDFSKFVYTRTDVKSTVICSKHGEYLAKPNGVLLGYGCPSCKESNGEKLVAEILSKLEVKYIREYMINGHMFRYDFYLPEYNLFIEFHGEQHYRAVDYFGGEKGFLKTKTRDAVKVELVKLNKGKLIVFNYKQLNLGEVKFKSVVTNGVLIALKGFHQKPIQ